MSDDTLFDHQFAITLKHEGGEKFTNYPNDPGGKTKYGISERYNPGIDIENLTYNQARNIYLNKYWIKTKCGEVPESIRCIYFDMCVNPGSYAAVKILQMAVNGAGYGKIKVDGMLGPRTLSLLPHVTPETLRLYRLNYYCQLVRHNHSKAENIGGWSRRAIEV